MFRRFTLAMICLALPLQAIAAVVPPGAPCSMESMQTDGMEADGGMSSLPDCCNDEDTFARTGEPCKSAQECTVPTTTAAPSLAGLAHAAPVAQATDRWSTPPPYTLVATPWRPPAAL